MPRRPIHWRPKPLVPPEPTCPVDTERSKLYSFDDLFDHAEYAQSRDARAYSWSRLPETRESARAQALHDFAIDQALDRWAESKRVVGVMGGHALVRGHDDYLEAAYLGRALGQRHVVATGGGPGAMEAANLGAWCADLEWEVMEQIIDEVSQFPSFTPSIGAWANPALAAVRRTASLRPERPTSLGIPTWFYGHEPPNVFCDAIAKYFRNATREAVLLELCNAGIVFLPGAGGTVQEIFQDACENYYATPEHVAPMVLVGVKYWTETFPAWPLLQALAKGRAMENEIFLLDTAAEASALLVERAT